MNHVTCRSVPCATVRWTDARLTRITALNLSAGYGTSWFDVLSCRGQLEDGTDCFVRLPFHQILKGRERITIVRHAKTDRVFANGLGIIEAIRYADKVGQGVSISQESGYEPALAEAA